MRKRVAGSLPHQPARRGRSVMAAMLLVDETAAHGAGTAVEILVAAPDGEIDVPLVQLQRHVAGGVGQVETDETAVPVGGVASAAARSKN